jgi:hypothetical protein
MNSEQVVLEPSASAMDAFGEVNILALWEYDFAIAL